MLIIITKSAFPKDKLIPPRKKAFQAASIVWNYVEIGSIVLKKKCKIFNACTRLFFFPFERRALFIIEISATPFINGEFNKDWTKQAQWFFVANMAILMLNVNDDKHKHMSLRCIWLYHETSVLLNYRLLKSVVPLWTAKWQNVQRDMKCFATISCAFVVPLTQFQVGANDMNSFIILFTFRKWIM